MIVWQLGHTNHHPNQLTTARMIVNTYHTQSKSFANGDIIDTVIHDYPYRCNNHAQNILTSVPMNH